MLEKWVYGINPTEFLKLFETIEESQKDWNQHCKKCLLLFREEDDKDQVDLFATFIKSPGFFLAGRVFVDARYLMRDPKKDQYMAIFSSNGNEDIAKQFASNNDLEGSALAKTIISGHWWMPIIEEGQVVGTKAIYLNQSDFGGNIPKWLVRQFVPKAIIETYDSLIKAAKR